MIAVIDTSAVIRLYIPDGPIPEGFESFMQGVESGQNFAIAPELMLVEVGNVLNKKSLRGELSNDEVKELMQLILKLPIQYFSHTDLMLDAVEVAIEHKLTVYDALFVALAKNKGATLFSGDKEMLKIAKKMQLLAAL